MFTQPAPAPSPAGLTSPASASASASAGPSSSSSHVSPASPSRTSRLRGLSYLRNYTQNHLLSREHSNGGSTSPSTSTPPSASVAAQQAGRPTASLTRSLSYSPTTTSTTTTTQTTTQTLTTTASNTASHSHRFSLVPTLSHPLGSSSAAERPSNPTASQSSSSNATSGIVGRNTDSTSLGYTASAADSTPGRTSMTRTRSATAGDAMAAATAAASTNGNNTTAAAATHANGSTSPLDILPSIRFSTFYDPRATRPSLTFTPIARTLPTGSEVIRVGRYSERDSQPPVPVNVPSAAPVGFKSKVVSRRHCEFWYEGGKWYIRDVKSSSGTFLNHIRLSPPGTESKPFPVNDGDIVQLGIDFKGGEEMIFRCVKMRLELNRGWQNKLNTFNMTAHKRLRNITKSNEKTEGSAQSYSQDCSICLNSIAPCQCLFVAPCSHTWHYKCIRSLLSSPQYPIFICPNCRAAADLEAEVEDPEEWEQEESEAGGQEADGKTNGDTAEPPSTAPRDSLQAPQPSAEGSGRRSTDRSRAVSDRARPSSERKRKTPTASPRPGPAQVDDEMDVTMQMQLDEPAPVQPARINTAVSTASASNTGASTPSTIDSTRQVPSHAVSQPVPIPNAAAGASASGSGGGRSTRTPSPNGGSGVPGLNGTEGPITPRNDAGPWVFDGSGLRARASDGGITRMESLDGVAGAEID